MQGRSGQESQPLHNPQGTVPAVVITAQERKEGESPMRPFTVLGARPMLNYLTSVNRLSSHISPTCN